MKITTSVKNVELNTKIVSATLNTETLRWFNRIKMFMLQ